MELTPCESLSADAVYIETNVTESLKSLKEALFNIVTKSVMSIGECGKLKT